MATPAPGDGMSIPISENLTPKGLGVSPPVEAPASKLIPSSRLLSGHAPAWLQVTPFAAVFFVFFLFPPGLTVFVGFWGSNQYPILPAFTARRYVGIFLGCLRRLPHPSVPPNTR